MCQRLVLPAMIRAEQPQDSTRFVLALHVAKGRARFKIPGLYRSDALKRHLETHLSGRGGIRYVKASILTGNLLVVWDSDESPRQLLAIIEDGLPRAAPLHESSRRRGVTVRRRFDGAFSSHSHLSQPRQSWHHLSPPNVARQLKSSPAGLSSTAAAERISRYGHNRLPPPQRRSDWDILTGQAFNAPTALLGVSAAISVATGGILDAVVIASVVGINGAIGFLTERQAERTIRGLDRLPRGRVIALRDGVAQSVSAESLALGDVMALSPGDAVAADGRLFSATGLSLNESALTGESMPVTKGANVTVAEDSPLAERVNMVFGGTTVSGGSGLAMVTATGLNTEIGAIQAMTATVQRPATPMERELAQTARKLAYLSGTVCSAVFAIGLWRGFGFWPMLKASIALAVAAVPEGLPAVATTTLAVGVREMRRRQALIRRIDAVETLGSVQVFCLDKTGTLTQNRMTVQAVYAASKAIEVNGNHFSCNGEHLDPRRSETLSRLFEIITLCNEAAYDDVGPSAPLDGSPTEMALLVLARLGGVDIGVVRRVYPRISIEYRSEQRPYMRTIHRHRSGRMLAAVKGNPREVLGLCRRVMLDGEIRSLDESQRGAILEQNDRMAGEALRVLGAACAMDNSDEFIWLGLIGMADPLRPGIAALMQQFHHAGIETMMITGDQSATAYAVGRQLNLSGGKDLEILDSTALEKLDAEILAGLVRHTHVFARVSPANKLQIVQALQRGGKVVAMTGDGINDGPALKAADIGVAMGSAGTEVARSMADIVLQGDELGTMVAAVRQGRATYDNVRKAIHYLVATNLSEIEVMVAGIALAGAPLTPLQLLWINLISDIFPALALAMEPPEPGIMARPPRAPRERVIGRRDLIRMARESALIAAGGLSGYAYGVLRYGVGRAANTQAFMTLTLGQIIHAVVCRSRQRSVFSPGKRPSNPYLNAAVAASLILQVATVLLPGPRKLLGLTRLRPLDALVIGAGSLVPFIINEAMKGGGSSVTKPAVKMSV